MTKKRIFLLSLLVTGTLFLLYPRFVTPNAFTDGLRYARYVEIFLGRNPEPIPSPFIFRPLVPLLSTPFALFVSPIVSLSITSVIFMVAWAIILYHICLEIIDRDIVAFVVSGVALMNPITWNYGGAPLVDTTAMFFVGAIVLLTLRKSSVSTITMLVFFGMFAKELVFFAGLFYLLYNRSLVSSLPLMVNIPLYLVFRYAVVGSISQPLAIHVFQSWFMTYTLYALAGLIVLSVPYILVRDRKAFELFIIGFLAFSPYMLLGMFNAVYGPRFAWPLQLALIPLACIGLDYMFFGGKKSVINGD